MRLRARIVLFVSLFALSTARGEVVLIDQENGRPAGMLSGKLLPEMPEDGIVDPAASITKELRTELSSTIEAAQEFGIEVSVVVLEDLPPVPPMGFGNEIIRRWTEPDSRAGALVLSYSREQSIPWVFLLGGVEMEDSKDRLPNLAARAMSNAGSGTSRADHAAQVGKLLTEFLVKEVGQTPVEAPVVAPPGVIESRDPARPAGQKKGRTTGWDLIKVKIPFELIGWAFGGFIGFVVLFFLMRAMVTLLRYRPKRFPEVDFRTRFEAPFSGGNNARVFFVTKEE